MNDVLEKLVGLYEEMLVSVAEEAEQTAATNAFDEAIRLSAAKNGVEPRVLRSYVKSHYFEKIRAEERRRGLPPPPRDS